jgi:hypothetical protein
VSDLEREMQGDWFVREVKRCREIGMPLGCCDEWPECSHVLEWTEQRDTKRDLSSPRPSPLYIQSGKGVAVPPETSRDE